MHHAHNLNSTFPPHPLPFSFMSEPPVVCAVLLGVLVLKRRDLAVQGHAQKAGARQQALFLDAPPLAFDARDLQDGAPLPIGATATDEALNDEIDKVTGMVGRPASSWPSDQAGPVSWNVRAPRRKDFISLLPPLWPLLIVVILADEWHAPFSYLLRIAISIACHLDLTLYSVRPPAAPRRSTRPTLRRRTWPRGCPRAPSSRSPSERWGRPAPRGLQAARDLRVLWPGQRDLLASPDQRVPVDCPAIRVTGGWLAHLGIKSLGFRPQDPPLPR